MYGDNVINVTEAYLEAGEFTMEFTTAIYGNYIFASGSLYISQVAINGLPLTQNDDLSYTLLGEETYVITFKTFLVSAAGNQDLNISIVPEEEEEEEVLTILTTGENTITVTETDITNEFILAQFFVMEAGDYTFDSDISVIIYDDYANYIEPNLDGSYTLEAYLNCSITLSTVGLTAGEYEMNITFVAAEEEIVTISELVEGNNEFTVTETDILNEFISVEFLAFEAGNYTFAGEINMNVCDANANYIEPNQDGSYTFTAETTYTITLFTSGLEAGVYSINVSKA